MRTLHPLIVTAGLAALVLLTACGPTEGTATSPAPTTGGTGTASPTPEPTQNAPTATTLPPDCLDLVSQADPATFGSTPLNSPVFTDAGPTGVVVPSQPAADASPLQVMRALAELSCLWADPNADITHLAVRVGHVPAEISAAMVTTLTSDGYVCESANGGTQCSITTPNTQFPVDDSYTYLVRDDIVIQVDQTNFPTNNLMGSMAAQIWG